MRLIVLTFKIFIGRLTLTWWTFRDEMLERFLGEYIVHIYEMDEQHSISVVYKGKETIYYSVRASYGRKRLYHCGRLFANQHWFNKEEPYLLMENCSPQELPANHIMNIDTLESIMENVEKLDQITSKLNLAANKFTA
jgi:hypothetical protein